MPNWCDNELIIAGEDVSVVLEAIRGEHSPINFQRIVPMPALLRNTVRGRRSFDTENGTVDCEEWYWDANGERPFTPEEEAELERLGARCWYYWCIANWGTKWNACEARLVKKTPYCATVYFETAWGPPLPVLQALSEQFSEHTFELSYWEEGGFCGVAVAKRGKVDVQCRCPDCVEGRKKLGGTTRQLDI